MLRQVFLILWLFLPAGVANGTPVLAAKLPWLGAPLDGGLTFRGKRLFGPNKTWRGVITGIIMATLTLWLQQIAVRNIHWLQTVISPINYTHLPILTLGFLFGIGALGGDAIESFFKRQRGIASGNGWFPFDQTDYIVGSAVAITPLIRLNTIQYAEAVVLWLTIHLTATYLGYRIGLRARPI